MEYVNFGDVSVEHGQIWIAYGDYDFAECVDILCGSDIGLADNQYMITQGSIYFSPNNWDAALNVCGIDRIGPPEYLEIAYAYNAYQGFDADIWLPSIVQVGKTIDDWTASGTTCNDPDVILHGNASIDKYIRDNYLF